MMRKTTYINGKRLTDEMRRKGITVKHMAAVCYSNVKTIQRARNENKITYQNLDNVSKCLDLSPDYLTDKRDNVPAETYNDYLRLESARRDFGVYDEPMPADQDAADHDILSALSAKQFRKTGTSAPVTFNFERIQAESIKRGEEGFISDITACITAWLRVHGYFRCEEDNRS